ncbi:putative carboxylesterase 15 [Carex littledalei]|uniref:Putative carboxylesterase 15 n=1 Tax=Carex littledalei TaxID=544730 RepID=A0A833QYE0_9POAL|nr:putative carboxylesterase 15 [Carex littledalei]
MATPTPTDTTNEPFIVEECRGLLKLMSDGTVIRSADPLFPFTLPDDGSIEWKDLLFHPIHSLHVRLYRPVKTPPNAKLPLLAFFHGGVVCPQSTSQLDISNDIKVARNLSKYQVVSRRDT